MPNVTIKFDSNQDYQIKAVESVVRLFEGMEKVDTSYVFELDSRTSMDKDTVPNVDELTEISSELLKENFDEVRKMNGLKVLPDFAPLNDGETLMCDIHKTEYYAYPEFTINMETGTGKTYVYLRTIYKLYKEYGWRKFVVVVPSIAIYEGAVNTFNATRNHFETLFGSFIPRSITEYDGNVTACKNFGTSTSVEILLMTIDSFNKSTNVIYKPTEKIRGGELPVSFIQETRPVVILDEVQNYQTENARRALRTLHPLCSIGYSATPGKNCPNELYRLSSYEACQQNLVKKIDVLGFQEEQIATSSADYFKVVSIKKSPLSVEIELNALTCGKLETKQFTIKASEKDKKTFTSLTKNTAYGSLAISEISVKENHTYVELSNGMRYLQDEESCASLTKEMVFRQMIRATIEEHIEKYSHFAQADVKVLSLFFIDRVASYKGDSPIIARIFDEEFEALKERVSAWKNLSGKDVREGYFAKRTTKKSKQEEEIDTPIDGTKTAEDKEAEKRAYNLIMKEKEKLLSKDEKVCFIFAHSALREGWDNPNVFQICALREITSESSRRQTIGRGLRLPVNQNGERIHEVQHNRLTVIAGESYSRFVEKLQNEYIEDGIMQKSFITDKRKIVKVRRTEKFNSFEFTDVWNKANRKTAYTINIKTDELVQEAVKAVNRAVFEPPKITCTRGGVVISIYKLKLEEVSPSGTALFNITIKNSECPDLFGATGTTFVLETGDIVGKKAGSALEKCPELAGLKVTEIHYDTVHPAFSSITFNKIDKPFLVGEVVQHETTSGQSAKPSTIDELDYPDVPKCNIIELAAKEVNLTRKTVLVIFSQLDQQKIADFMKNPNGFTSQFIALLKEVVANHIACNIEYSKTSEPISGNLEALFPQSEDYSAAELEDAAPDRTIYEKIQVDSEVERHFVQTLNTSDAATCEVTLYFKFPPKYKIAMPRIIGNYNPDWAIVRNENDTSGAQLELVRETKGTENLQKMWHANEARKIICAQKHFRAIHLDYKFVDDKNPEWWEKEDKDYAAEFKRNQP